MKPLDESTVINKTFTRSRIETNKVQQGSEIRSEIGSRRTLLRLGGAVASPSTCIFLTIFLHLVKHSSMQHDSLFIKPQSRIFIFDNLLFIVLVVGSDSILCSMSFGSVISGLCCSQLLLF